MLTSFGARSILYIEKNLYVKEKRVNIDYVKYAGVLKVFSDPKRLKIIHMLSKGELCAYNIQKEFQITQPTLSHDMKLMCDTGLVIPRKEGKKIYYSLNPKELIEVYEVLGLIMFAHEETEMRSQERNK